MPPVVPKFFVTQTLQNVEIIRASNSSVCFSNYLLRELFASKCLMQPSFFEKAKLKIRIRQDKINYHQGNGVPAIIATKFFRDFQKVVCYY